MKIVKQTNFTDESSVIIRMDCLMSLLSTFEMCQLDVPDPVSDIRILFSVIKSAREDARSEGLYF